MLNGKLTKTIINCNGLKRMDIEYCDFYVGAISSDYTVEYAELECNGSYIELPNAKFATLEQAVNSINEFFKANKNIYDEWLLEY